jgi:hypothetical protein
MIKAIGAIVVFGFAAFGFGVYLKRAHMNRAK